MNTEIVVTEDGSHTIKLLQQNITYHSIFGALQESRHVFINAGLHYFAANHPKKNNIHVFEMGFGTGLNALLALQYAGHQNKKINYTAVELNPITLSNAAILNYGKMTGAEQQFLQLHNTPWHGSTAITETFWLQKINESLLNFNAATSCDVIFYDAFAPDIQPELWTAAVFEKMYSMLNAGGILVTYCSKGDVKRHMKAVGFAVKRLAGPPGKWHMVRASKV